MEASFSDEVTVELREELMDWCGVSHSPLVLKVVRASFQYLCSLSVCGKGHSPPLPHC